LSVYRNLNARSDSQRTFYSDLIFKVDTRNKFDNEITIFKDE